MICKNITLFFKAAFFILLFTPMFGRVDALEGKAKLGYWTQDLKSAKKLAREKKLPILLAFMSETCNWCNYMNDMVFVKQQWKDYVKTNIVLVLVDVTPDPSKSKLQWWDEVSVNLGISKPSRQFYLKRNEKLARQYNVSDIPSYFIIGSDGKRVLGKLIGAIPKASPENFIRKVEEILRKKP